MEEVVATEEEWEAARAKAVAGVVFLTNRFGDTSWMELINVDTLDMGRSDLCVLGQLNSYTCGCVAAYCCMRESLGIDGCEEAALYGFDALGIEYRRGYQLLTAVWRELLSV